MNGEAVALEIGDGIATITLDRPAAGNTVNMDLSYTLLKAAIRCDADDSVRCVVLTGRGKLFCGGGDITSFPEAGPDATAYLSELAGVFHMAVSRLMRMRKPLLTLVNGPAAGAGLGLAICGDIVIAARSASFVAAHGTVGLSPDGGLSWLLPRMIGMRRAQEMIVTNRKVDAREAEEIGHNRRALAQASRCRRRSRPAGKRCAPCR